MIQDIQERRLLGGALGLLGLALAASSAVAGLQAAEHMASAAAMCGPTWGHCLWCVAASTLFVSALGASGAALSLLQPALKRRAAS
jgi:hypothetical protein